MTLTRSMLLAAGAGFALAARPSAAAALDPKALIGEPEIKSLKVGMAVQDIAYLNLYVARAMSLWSKEGLEVELIGFPGDAPVSQALVGGSVDLNIASMVGMLNLVQAGQPVKTIYLLSNQALFSFVGNAKVTKWSELKGGTFGVASYGSLTAALATAALEQHGLVVNKDVQLVQTGGSPNAYAALLSNQLSGSTFQLTYALQAKNAGLHVLGTQQQVTGPSWPDEAVYAKEAFLAKNPKTVTALLRGIAAADRIIATQPQATIKILEDALKIDAAIAAEAYPVVRTSFPQDGAFPKDLSGFWKTMIAVKTVPSIPPASAWYDPTWVDSFRAWGR